MTRVHHPERWIRSASLLLVSAACAACQRTAPPSPASTASQAAAGPATVEVVRVVEQPLKAQLALPAELTAYQTVAIHPRVNGFVKSVRVDRGSRVRAGDLLAELDAPELKAQRSEAESRLQAAEAQLAAVRAKAESDAGTYDKLKAAAATPGVVAGNDLLVAEKSMQASASQTAAAQQIAEAARQALAAVREMEGYLRVTAPFDGVVTERNVHPGALVGPGSGPGAVTPMLRIVEQAKLRLVVPVPEAYTARLSMGAEIGFSTAAYPNQTFTGTVARIAQSVDVSTRTMAVELDVVNTDGRLAPGTFCQVRWPVERPGLSLFVPSSSVATTTDRTFVIRVRDGKTDWVDVKTGLTSGALVEVFGPLQPGDQVAGRGTDEVRSGVEVRVKEAKPAAS